MSEPTSKNIKWHGAEGSQEDRERALGQRGCVVWFTGLSGSGKSTIARRVERKLLERKRWCYALDGDNLRMGLNADLGFSPGDRAENIRRVGSVAQLFADSGCICTCSFVSPYQADRDAARARNREGRFVEVHVATSLEACEARDPKGLYAKARAGLIPDFTGVTAPYEEPLRPEIRLETDGRSIDECAEEVIAWLDAAGLLSA